MFLFVLCVVVLIVAIVKRDVINNKFNKPTFEELDTFQDSVLAHLSDVANSYEREIKSIYNDNYSSIKYQSDLNIKKMDEMLKEMQRLEKSLDEKISEYRRQQSMFR